MSTSKVIATVVFGISMTTFAIPSAYAASCDEAGNYRKGRHIRVQARDRSDTWNLSEYVYRIVDIEGMGSSYKNVSSFRIDKTNKTWETYFHVKAVKPLGGGEKDIKYVRCDIAGSAKRVHSVDNYTEMKYKYYECYLVDVNSDGAPIKNYKNSSLPVSVSCNRNYSPDNTRLTIKFSFGD